MNKQLIEWIKITKDLKIEDVINLYKNPHEFQVDLKNIINEYSEIYRDIIEVGCDTGVTSLILSDKFNKTLLDINPYAIELSKSVADKLNKKVTFVVADMFNMPFEDKSFDIVFNSGVIEHFDADQRTMLLAEYSRILRDNGLIIIGFPNHYSLPYRLAYVLHKKVLLGYNWPSPNEFKIFDMKNEIVKNNLILEKRVIVSKNYLFGLWNKFKPVKYIFKILDKFINFQSYLTVLVIRKNKEKI
ncbi:type 11 methyltransferase [Thermincola ferriacetica]|uniref:Type 11 methyltransferase n=1 Tax=Thermincola ferriacetica TaxID=281456 RepID=A0A0L6W390_9FIRM|nr:class I SAM-dependent methyltransferase [Thermincola ferriacetica]KNZ70047.1 type 11 methyltransferase [Thermincola ferriacetica]